MDQCFLFGVFEFPGGTWAQWFSGTASALAVAVALGAHFYAAWRQRKSEDREDAAEVAGISMLLRRILLESQANARMFFSACRIMNLWGKDYTVSQRLVAVRAVRVELLDKNQADVLLRYGASDLAARINLVASRLNIANSGIEDYATARSDLHSELSKYPNSLADLEQVLDADAEEAKILARKLNIISNAAKTFIERTRSVLDDAIEIADNFSTFCSKNVGFERYSVQTDKARKVAEEVAAPAGASEGSE